jgi:hypothetical protein
MIFLDKNFIHILRPDETPSLLRVSDRCRDGRGNMDRLTMDAAGASQSSWKEEWETVGETGTDGTFPTLTNRDLLFKCERLPPLIVNQIGVAASLARRTIPHPHLGAALHRLLALSCVLAGQWTGLLPHSIKRSFAQLGTHQRVNSPALSLDARDLLFLGLLGVPLSTDNFKLATL